MRCLMLSLRGVARNLLRGDKLGGLGDGSPPAESRGRATDALTTDSGKWLDAYGRRPQGLESDLLEYGNPTQNQRGRDKKN